MTTPGDTPATPRLGAVKCPSCGGPITLRALGQSVAVACPSCGALLDASHPQLTLIRKYQAATRRFRLKLGARGALRGTTLEVVGALERSEGSYTWDEYLLFNPAVGFRWLVDDHGHWSIGEPIKDTSAIQPSGNRLCYRNEYYRPFHNGSPKIECAVGEFYWRVATGSRANCSDYVAQGTMLSKEKSAGEISWTLLQYLQPEEMSAAFGLATGLRAGIAPHQPNPSYAILQAIRPFALAAVAGALVVQGIAVFSHQEREQVLGTIYPASAAPTDDLTFGPIELADGHSLVGVTARDFGLDNAWVELQCSLVNDATGTSIEFTNGIEQWSGYSDGEAWAEGEGQHVSLVSSVPAGRYTLVVNASSGGSLGQPVDQPVTLALERDLVPWRNFWIALLAIVAYPAFLAWRGRMFEKERWIDSEFDPYDRDD